MKDSTYYKGILLVLLITLLAAVGGCSWLEKKPDTPAKATAEETMRAGMLDLAGEAAKQPLLKLVCPASGCILGSLEVGNPANAQHFADTVKVVMAPQPSELSANYRATLAVLGKVGGYAVIGSAAKGIFGKITDGFASGYKANVDIASKIQAPAAPGAITNTTVNNSIGGSGVIGSGSFNAPTTTTSTVTNNARVCGITYSSTGVPTGFTCSGG